MSTADYRNETHYPTASMLIQLQKIAAIKDGMFFLIHNTRYNMDSPWRASFELERKDLKLTLNATGDSPTEAVQALSTQLRGLVLPNDERLLPALPAPQSLDPDEREPRRPISAFPLSNPVPDSDGPSPRDFDDEIPF